MGWSVGQWSGCGESPRWLKLGGSKGSVAACHVAVLAIERELAALRVRGAGDAG